MIKKLIKVYSLHPACKDLNSFIKHYAFDYLTQKFDFVWDTKDPDYLFVAEHIYRNYKIFTEL